MTAEITLRPINDEIRVLDTDLAQRLGYAEPRFIRAKLIKKHEAELRSYGELIAIKSDTGKPGPKPKAYYLNEE